MGSRVAVGTWSLTAETAVGAKVASAKAAAAARASVLSESSLSILYKALRHSPPWRSFGEGDFLPKSQEKRGTLGVVAVAEAGMDVLLLLADSGAGRLTERGPAVLVMVVVVALSVAARREALLSVLTRNEPAIKLCWLAAAVAAVAALAVPKSAAVVPIVAGTPPTGDRFGSE